MSNASITVGGHKVTFERRRYGRQFYCWAYVHVGNRMICCGDPWPAANWPAKDLREAVRFYSQAPEVANA